MTMKRLMLVINPISGTGSKKDVPLLTRKRLDPLGYDIDLRYTAGRGDATRLAREAVEEGYFGVIACGGDGTVNETARALCDTTVALGIIPAGSGNGLARHVGIPIDIEKSLDVIALDHVVACDYGTVDQRQFFCTFGMGFDAAVAHRFARQNRRGLLRYVKSAITEYIKYRPQTYTISANGRLLTERAFLIAVCNASQWGNNAYIAPEASITDGLLDIAVVHGGSPIDAAVMGMDIFTGQINRNTMVQTFRAPAAVIYRSAAGEAHIDGEPVMLPDILDIKCHHEGLNIFSPAHKGAFRPIVTPARDLCKGLNLSLMHLLRRLG